MQLRAMCIHIVSVTSASEVYTVTCYVYSHFTFTLHYITLCCRSYSGIPTCGLFDLNKADELPSSAFIFIHLLKLTGKLRQTFGVIYGFAFVVFCARHWRKLNSIYLLLVTS